MRYFQLILALIVCLFVQIQKSVAAEADDGLDSEVLAEIRQHARPEKAERRHARRSQRIQYSLTPMLGTALYGGGYGRHVGNAFDLGLGFEFPMSRFTAFELEGNYGDYNATYSGFMHDFSKYSVGGNVKVYLTQSGWVRPYVGTGFQFNYFSNMFATPDYKYDRWIGSGQLMAGTELQVEKSVSLGIRGGWILPAANRPETRNAGRVTAPGFEDAAIINKDYYRLLGTVKVAL